MPSSSLCSLPLLRSVGCPILCLSSSPVTTAWWKGLFSRAGKVWRGHWSDFSLMSCYASCKSRKSCYSLHLLPEALARLGTRFPSLCRSAAFSALSLPFLFWLWASWQRSDFGAHSSLHTVKGSCKRVEEKVRKEKKKLGWRFFRRLFCCLSLKTAYNSSRLKPWIIKLWITWISKYLDFQVVLCRKLY